MAYTFNIGDRARYTARWLRSTCSYLDTDGTNGWGTISDVSNGPRVVVVTVEWPNGISRRILAANLQRKGAPLRVRDIEG